MDNPPSAVGDDMSTSLPPADRSRRNTLTSTSSTDRTTDTCRICRSEGTTAEPLFHPCKCSGSIKFVHQDCLMEWLSHSHKEHCELCKTPFRFTKLYDANMPSTLPYSVFLRRAAVHIILGCIHAMRVALVALVWLGLIPWVVRWVWRWFFWVADAAWAREAFMETMTRDHHLQEADHTSTKNVMGWAVGRFRSLASGVNVTGQSAPLVYNIAKSMGLIDNDRTTTGNVTFVWPQAHPSILSGWPHLAELTSNSSLNRLILDVFEGQIVTCLVITGFILVFLIREWVVQQQPIANIEQLGNLQQQFREAADRVQADNDRPRQHRELLEAATDRVDDDYDEVRRQMEALHRARARLMEIQASLESPIDQVADGRAPASNTPEEMWQSLELSVDAATRNVREDGEQLREDFVRGAARVFDQIRAAQRVGTDMTYLMSKLQEKLDFMSREEKTAWEAVMLTDFVKATRRRTRSRQEEALTPDLQQQPQSEGSRAVARPGMPNRGLSSRATEIRRSLEEAESAVGTATAPSGERDVGEEPRDGVANSRPASSTTSPQGPPSAMNLSSDGNGLTNGDRNDTNTARWADVGVFTAGPVPITNAGPDVKINIRLSHSIAAKGEFPPKIDAAMLDIDDEKKQHEEEAANGDSEAGQQTDAAADDASDETDKLEQSSDDEGTAHVNENPFHPDGAMPPERRNSDTFSNRVASVFREEFGLDEADNTIIAQPAGAGRQMGSGDSEERDADGTDERPSTFLDRLADWFWGDIQPSNAQEIARPPDAEGEANNLDANVAGQEAAFAAEHNDGIQAAQLQPEVHDAPVQDLEVAAAAREAGLDAEAIEDAEDMEGIFELLGLQGPLIGLVQTSAFCTLLVGCTILGAVIAPYVWGKLVLNFVGSPVYLLVQLPLRSASVIADVVVDTTILIGSMFVMLLSMGADFLSTAVFGPGIWDKATAYAERVLTNSGHRLMETFASEDANDLGSIAWSWAFLTASVHAHASLRTMQNEVGAVVTFLGNAVTAVVNTVSSGTVSESCYQSLKSLPHLPSAIVHFAQLANEYLQPLYAAANDLRHGSLTFSKLEVPVEPTLVYWNSTDRALAILAGYTALAALAAIYVAMDTPITKSEAGRKTEKHIRDTLRQAGGVLKVILIISIEMLVFPLYCGMLLDLAFLPLFQGTSVATRWAYANSHPYTFCFMHWFIGTCYMFHFALFVGMCRKILRNGVLWFIRDPDDPTFHPVRDVLERNVGTQLRKIAFSALVYGALVILCLGGVIWSIGRMFDGIFPIHWVSTEPVMEFPLDLLLYNFVTPVIIRLFRPSDAVNSMYAWWLRRCARVLRLSHFLFDDRRKEEEGHVVRKTWMAFLLAEKSQASQSSIEETDALDTSEDGRKADAYFQMSGKYVLTPCNDQYRPPKPGEAFLHVEETEVYIADKEGNRNEHFSKVYVPPFFRLRITLFMVCLWIFSAVTGLCVTLVPLVCGRSILSLFLSSTDGLNDIYAYSLGAYLLGGLLSVALKGKDGAQWADTKIKSLDFASWIAPAKTFVIRVLKCAYVYGFLGLVVPLIFALVLQFYLILPLHTWLTFNGGVENSFLSTPVNSTSAVTGIDAEQGFVPQIAGTKPLPLTPLGHHTIHILQDYALGVIYVRLAGRFIITAPASRAAAAFRRVTSNGYLNPDVRLATRFVILPVSLIACLVLLLPPLVAKSSLTFSHLLSPSSTWLADADLRTKLYRYSYPFAASALLFVLATAEVGKATNRWRATIRDEVYLVGERLHNFGEKRPPAGSRTVLRKER